MPLGDLQFSYRGLIFGADTEYHVNRAEGFEGFDARTSDSDNPRGDGAIRGSDYVGARTVAFELAVIELTGGDTTYEKYWRTIRQAFAPSRDEDFPLVFKRPGMPERQVYCRPVQLTRKEAYRQFNAVGFPPVVLRASDPRIYSTEAKSAIVPVYANATTGVDFPSEFPIDFGSGSNVEAVVVNEGTAPAYPLIRFYAPTPESEPVYYPADDIFPAEDIFPNEPDYAGSGSGTTVGVIKSVKLINTTTGDVLEVVTDVVGGQILIADMAAAVTGAPRQVISVDDTSRYGAWKLPRSAFSLAPGANTLRFEVTGTANNARCHVSWSDTWLD